MLTLRRKSALKLPATPLAARSIQWLAALVLLAQFPHYFHLPWWVSLFGAMVVAGRVSGIASKSSLGAILFSTTTLTIIAATAAIAVRLHYGYFLGRDPCVAFLFLLVSFKFGETRYNKDGTLLICLSGFLLLTQYFYSQTFLAALISLPAVITMGGCLSVMRDSEHKIPIKNSITLTAKLLLQGLPVAAALFLLFPRLPGPLWSMPTDTRGATGLSDSMSPGSISSLSLSGDVAFRVDFEGRTPTAEQLYWRGPIFSQFDGRQWSAISQQRSKPVQLKPTTQDSVSYIVTLEPHNRSRLFALDMPAGIPERVGSTRDSRQPLAYITSDLQLLTKKPVGASLRYRQTSTLSAKYQELEPPLIANLQLAGRNPKTESFAREQRKKYSSDAAFVNALMKWFNEEQFHYTLKPDLLGASPVDEFLFGTKRGFCEHYASSLAVILRAASIPARVVTGYLGGEVNGDYMIVRQSDAHAWTEAWISNRWVRIDPTTAVAPERVNSLWSALPESSNLPAAARRDNRWIRQAQLRWDAFNHQWQRQIVDFNNKSQSSLWKSLGFKVPEAWQIIAVLLGLAAIWSLILLRFNVRVARRSPEDKLWQQFCTRLAQAGLPRLTHEGPVDFQTRAISRWPEQQQPLMQLSQLLAQLRYSNPSDAERKQLLNSASKALQSLPSSRVLKQRHP